MANEKCSGCGGSLEEGRFGVKVQAVRDRVARLIGSLRLCGECTGKIPGLREQAERHERKEEQERAEWREAKLQEGARVVELAERKRLRNERRGAAALVADAARSEQPAPTEALEANTARPERGEEGGAS